MILPGSENELVLGSQLNLGHSLGILEVPVHLVVAFGSVSEFKSICLLEKLRRLNLKGASY